MRRNNGKALKVPPESKFTDQWSVNFDSGGTFNAFPLFRRNPDWTPQDRS